ncbi:MAG: MarR family winged helix-turn-helix transcriptional regulator [Actinomycetota bacterium]
MEPPSTPATGTDPPTPRRRPHDRLTWLFHHAIGANEAALRDIFRDLDITMAQFLALTDVARLGEVPPAHLAYASGISRQSMHASLRRMQRAGLVRLHPAYDGRGANVVAITKRGEAVRRRAEEQTLWFERLIAARLGDPRRDELARLLRAYVRTIEQLWNRPSVAAWQWDD